MQHNTRIRQENAFRGNLLEFRLIFSFKMTIIYCNTTGNYPDDQFNHETSRVNLKHHHFERVISAILARRTHSEVSSLTSVTRLCPRGVIYSNPRSHNPAHLT